MNQPSRDVGGIKKSDGIHWAPLLSGTLVLEGCAVRPLGSINASWASASSTSRRIFSREKRAQLTRNAKDKNAIQLISSTRSIRGSIEPPPPITGWGCCVRKNQMEK